MSRPVLEVRSFAAFLLDADYAQGLVAAERVRSAVQDHNFPAVRKDSPGDQIHHITISVGVAAFPDDARDPIHLIELADAALYRVKRNGPKPHMRLSPFDCGDRRPLAFETQIRTPRTLLSETTSQLLFFVLSKIFGGTAAERPEEGSQGQAQSEAERAAPGDARNKDKALERATEATSTNDPVSVFARFQRVDVRVPASRGGALCFAPHLPLLSRLRRTVDRIWLRPSRAVQSRVRFRHQIYETTMAFQRVKPT